MVDVGKCVRMGQKLHTALVRKNVWKRIIGCPLPIAIAAFLCVTSCTDDSGNRSDAKPACGDGI